MPTNKININHTKAKNRSQQTQHIFLGICIACLHYWSASVNQHCHSRQRQLNFCKSVGRICPWQYWLRLIITLVGQHSVVEEPVRIQPPAQATLSMYSIFLKIGSTLCSGNFFSLNLSNNANYLFQLFKYLFWCPEPDLVLFSISVPVPLQKASSTAVIPKHCSPYSTQLGQFLLFSLIIGEGDRLFHI